MAKEQADVVMHDQQNAERAMTIAGSVLACAEYSLTPPDSTKKIIVKDRAVLADNKLECAKYNMERDISANLNEMRQQDLYKHICTALQSGYFSSRPHSNKKVV